MTIRKIELGYSGSREVRIDLRTKEHSGTSINQFVTDENTEVYHGHDTSVNLKDIQLRVTMDPKPGNWKGAGWAREQAWKAMFERLTFEDLKEILDHAFAAGKQEGKKEKQKEIREALGIQKPSRCHCTCGGLA